MTKNVKEIEDFARETFSKNGMDWFVKNHVECVEKFALKLADIKGADKDVVKMAAWLHDIDHTKDHAGKNHHIENSKFATKILTESGFDEKIVKAVEHCILAHRCKDGYKPENTEAKILASADAMSHIENFGMFLFVSLFLKEHSREQSYEWLSKKIGRDWNNKILIPEGKEMVKSKYNEVMLLLKEMGP